MILDKPKLVITVGISGSGKSYYAKELLRSDLNFVEINNDSLRRGLFGIDYWEEYNWDNESVITAARYKLLSVISKYNKNIIISDLNLSKSHLKRYQKWADKNGYSLKIVLFDIPLDLAKFRNSKRTEMSLVDSVIDTQYIHFQQVKKVIQDRYKDNLILISTKDQESKLTFPELR